MRNIVSDFEVFINDKTNAKFIQQIKQTDEKMDKRSCSIVRRCTSAIAQLCGTNNEDDT